MKRVMGASAAALAEFGEVGAGQDADRRADQDAEAVITEAAGDGVEQTAGAAGRRSHLREHHRRRARRPAQQRPQNPGQPEQANTMASTDMPQLRR